MGQLTREFFPMVPINMPGCNGIAAAFFWDFPPSNCRVVMGRSLHPAGGGNPYARPNLWRVDRAIMPPPRKRKPATHAADAPELISARTRLDYRVQSPELLVPIVIYLIAAFMLTSVGSESSPSLPECKGDADCDQPTNLCHNVLCVENKCQTRNKRDQSFCSTAMNCSGGVRLCFDGTCFPIDDHPCMWEPSYIGLFNMHCEYDANCRAFLDACAPPDRTRPRPRPTNIATAVWGWIFETDHQPRITAYDWMAEWVDLTNEAINKENAETNRRWEATRMRNFKPVV